MRKSSQAPAAALEILTGLTVVAEPSLVARWLFGGDLAGAAVAFGRLTGVALLCFGLACWPRRGDGLQGLRAILLYNALVLMYLVWLRVGGAWVGSLSLPAIALHAILAALLGRELAIRRRAGAG